MNMIVSITQNSTFPSLIGTLVNTKAASAENRVPSSTAGTTTITECSRLDSVKGRYRDVTARRTRRRPDVSSGRELSPHG